MRRIEAFKVQSDGVGVYADPNFGSGFRRCVADTYARGKAILSKSAATVKRIQVNLPSGRLVGTELVIVTCYV